MIAFQGELFLRLILLLVMPLTILLLSIAFSPSGWTDNELNEAWMKNVFLPFADKNRIDATKPVVLTCDGHESHETPGIKKAVYTYEGCEFIILCFPSKCTHKMQPLDVVVFAQSGRGWREHCDECLYRGIVINRYNVVQNYLQVREKYMTQTLIKSGFKKTGIYPLNRNVFTKEDFAPSKASSTIAWTPSSYPEEVPSSDPAIPSDAESERDSNVDGQENRAFRDAHFEDESGEDDPSYKSDSDLESKSESGKINTNE